MKQKVTGGELRRIAWDGTGHQWTIDIKFHGQAGTSKAENSAARSRMRVPWSKSPVEQLDLVEVTNAEPSARLGMRVPDPAVSAGPRGAPSEAPSAGLPLIVPLDCLEEEPANPRSESPEAEVAELARSSAL